MPPRTTRLTRRGHEEIDRRAQVSTIVTSIVTFAFASSTFYSHPISDKLFVEQANVGLACVTKLHDIYHRIYIQAQHQSTVVILYVDLGLTESVSAKGRQFKHLISYFATVPRLAISCHLAGIELKQSGGRLPAKTCEMLQSLCNNDPFHIITRGMKDNEVLVKIRDVNGICLNDRLVREGLAMRMGVRMST